MERDTTEDRETFARILEERNALLREKARRKTVADRFFGPKGTRATMVGAYLFAFCCVGYFIWGR